MWLSTSIRAKCVFLYALWTLTSLKQLEANELLDALWATLRNTHKSECSVLWLWHKLQMTTTRRTMLTLTHNCWVIKGEYNVLIFIVVFALDIQGVLEFFQKNFCPSILWLNWDWNESFPLFPPILFLATFYRCISYKIMTLNIQSDLNKPEKKLHVVAFFGL